MTNFEKLINEDKPVVVDFFAEWCGPCKMMPPVLAALKKKKGDTIRVIKLDIDKNPAYARQYNVQSVPTLVVFHKGKIIWRAPGVQPVQEIERHLP